MRLVDEMKLVWIPKYTLWFPSKISKISKTWLQRVRAFHLSPPNDHDQGPLSIDIVLSGGLESLGLLISISSLHSLINLLRYTLLTFEIAEEDIPTHPISISIDPLSGG